MQEPDLSRPLEERWPALDEQSLPAEMCSTGNGWVSLTDVAMRNLGLTEDPDRVWARGITARGIAIEVWSCDVAELAKYLGGLVPVCRLEVPHGG